MHTQENIKNFRNFQNDTHVKKVGHTSEFFLAFIDELWKTRKIRILKKWKKKNAGDIIILHQKPKTTIIWGIIPEIQSGTFFFSFWVIFCPLHPPPPPISLNLENQNFEKNEKKTGFELTSQSCIMKNYVKKIYWFECHVKGHNGPRDRIFRNCACCRDFWKMQHPR